MNKNLYLDTEKLGVKTFSVTYEDESTDLVKPVSWKKLEDIKILQYQILQNSASLGGCVGDLLSSSNKDFWEPANRLSKLMPVVGKDSGIQLDKIEDPDEIIEIFVTSTTHRDEETGYITPGTEGFLLPSRISRVNGLNFLGLLMKVQKEVMSQLNTSKT